MVLGPDLVRLRWLQGTFGIVKLLEKNAFAGMRFSVPMTFAVCAALLIDALLPLAVLAMGSWGVAAAALMYAGIAVGVHANRKLNGISPAYALFFAPCVLLLAWAFARSMVLTVARGGVVWRDTFYPLAELKKNMIPFRMG
jgi:hypothetical protein